jgi:NAD(P)-dependent dehydrogenase (short-subunit alcohol dehydrogenase family)
VINYASSRAGADTVIQRVRQAGGKAVAVQADVSKPEDVRRLFAETKKAFGRLDILVNNAGIYEFAPLEAAQPGTLSQARQSGSASRDRPTFCQAKGQGPFPGKRPGPMRICDQP